MRRLSLLALWGLSGLLPGCAVVHLRYQDPPPRDLGGVEPGQTWEEVLARLGPPEEFRRPGVAEQPRLSSPQRRKVFDGHDVFRRDVWTYAGEHRVIRIFGLLPVGPSVFRWTRTNSREQRVQIEFDADGRVETAAWIDESEGEGP